MESCTNSIRNNVSGCRGVYPATCRNPIQTEPIRRFLRRPSDQEPYVCFGLLGRVAARSKHNLIYRPLHHGRYAIRRLFRQSSVRRQSAQTAWGDQNMRNEIYDPYTTRPDPISAGKIIRYPFSGNNVVPQSDLNQASLAILGKYYPAPNLNVAPGILPNYAFNGNTSTAADQMGIRIDKIFNDKNTAFFRFNRSNNNVTSPEGFPGYVGNKSNYSRAFAGGYTHLFGPDTILNLRYGYTETSFSIFDEPAGVDFINALNFSLTAPVKNNLPLGPGVGIANGDAMPGSASLRLPWGHSKTATTMPTFQRSPETIPSALRGVCLPHP